MSKNIFKRVVSLLLSVTLMIGAVPFLEGENGFNPFVLKSEAATYGDLTYEVVDGAITITDCYMFATVVDIPAQIDGVPVMSIGNRAFFLCMDLTSITIPNSVTSIGDEAFYRCIGLTSITIPDGVTSIGEGAFVFCESLTSITIPDSVISIDSLAFEYCTSLTSITIPDGVTGIGFGAFRNCISLTAIDVDPNSLSFSDINGVLFNKTFTELLCYPAGKQNAGYTIPDSVRSIGFSAFSGCTNLTSITIPGSVKAINIGAFAKCTSLTSITIPDSVEFIGNDVFYNCTNLASITIPDSVIFIAPCAFLGCSSLTTITIPESVTFIGESVLSGCTSLTSIDVDPNNISFSDINGVLFNKTITELLCYPAGKQNAEYTIPDSVTSVGNWAFSDCTSLTSITIPDSVKSIGDGAFCGCTSLSTITIPDSVTSIGYDAFLFCDNLTILCTPGSYAETYAIDNNIKYKYISGNAPKESYFSKSDISIQVSHNDLPVSGAKVVISNQIINKEFYTAADGYVHENLNVSGFANLTITKNGYHSYSEPTIFPLYKTITVNLKDEDTPYLKKATLNDKSILKERGFINRNLSGDVKLEFDYVSKQEPSSYTISCGSFKSQSANPEFTIPRNNFFMGQKVFLTANYPAPKESETIPLNITVLDFAVPGGLEFGLEGGKIGLTYPDFVPIFNGQKLEIDFDALKKNPAILKITDEYIQCGFKTDITNDEELNEKLTESLTNTKRYNEIVKKLKKEMDKKLKNESTTITPETKFKLDFGGYAEIYPGYESKNQISQVKGVAFFQVKVSAGFDVDFVVVVVPMTVRVEIDGKGKVMLDILGFDFDNAEWIFPGLSLEAKIELCLKLGIGCKLASAGIYGSGEFKALIDITPVADVRDLKLSGELGVYGKLIFLEAKFSLLNGSMYIRKDGVWGIITEGDSVFKNSLSGNDMVVLMTDLENYSLIDRSSYSAYNQPALRTFSLPEPDIIRSNVYTYIQPQIVTAGNTTIMAYIDNDASRDDYNFQTLVYSIYENGSWSAPVKLDTNDTFDDEFSLYSNGNDIYVAYTEANAQFTADDSYETIASKFEVSTARFDSTTGSFTDFATLTNDAEYDSQPIMTAINSTPTVIWTNNSANNMIGNTGSNAIKMSVSSSGIWQTKVITDNLSAITSIDSGLLSDGYYIAAICDTDNDLTTQEDRVLSLFNSSGEKTEIIIESNNNDNARFNNNTLTWYNNYNYASISSSGQTPTFLLDNPVGDTVPAFEIINLPDGKEAIIYTAQADNGSDLFAIISDGSGWSNPVRLTETEHYIDAYDLAIIDDKLMAAFVETNPTISETDIQTQSNLKFSEVDLGARLTVSDVEFDKLEMVVGEDLPISFNVTNNGTKTSGLFKAEIVDEQDNVLSSQDYTEVVLAGETLACEIDFVLPEYNEDTNYFITITEGENVTKEKLDLFSSDFEVRIDNYIREEDNEISVTVVNTGFKKGAGALYGYSGGVDGKLIFQKEIELLNPGDGVNYSFGTDIIYELDSSAELLTFVFVADVEEEYTLNNQDSIVIIKLDDNTFYLGDINSDGTINSNDVIALLQYSVGLSTPFARHNADVNGDEIIDNRDAICLLRAIVDIYPYNQLIVKN